MAERREHPPPETADERADRLLRIALEVAVRLREEPADAVVRELDGLDTTEIRDLALIACAGVDVTRTITDLYGWCDVDRVPPRATRLGPNGKPLAPCGSHSAHNRHRRNGEPLDVVCVIGEQSYNACRYARGETRRGWPRTPKAAVAA